MASASYTVLSGEPLPESVDDSMLNAIITKSDLTYFISLGMFKPIHLRAYASMPKGNAKVLRQIANCPGTNPAAAVDFCVSAAFARALLEICKDTTVYHFYNHEDFTQRYRSLHDNRRGADAFRRSPAVYEVAAERILFGGDVLPEHMVRWFKSKGRHGQHARYMNNRLRDGAHMRKCYGEYETQTAARVGEGGIIAGNTYDFMVAYHSYTKYFPVFMYLLLQSNREKKVEETVADMKEKKCSKEQIEAAVRGMQAMEIEKAAEQKKKQRKLAKLTSRDGNAKELFGAVNFAGTCDGLIKNLIVSFLV